MLETKLVWPCPAVAPDVRGRWQVGYLALTLTLTLPDRN